MPGLHELQKQFSTSLLDKNAAEAPDSILPDGFEPGQRIQVYRNNVFTGLTEALRAVYPVLEKLVGKGFFLYACDEYIRRFPSNSGDLHAYGSSFSSFLTAFGPAQGLPYLPDVARLEWSYHEAYHEADTAGLDFEKLSRIEPDRYQTLCFSLNPACRLLQSAFPIIDIWRVNQDDYEGDQSVDLDAGRVNVLLLRNAEEIELHSIDDSDYGMLESMNRNRYLDDCVSKVLATDNAFNLNAFLYKYIGNKTIVGLQYQPASR